MINLQSQVALTSYRLCDLQGRVLNQSNLTTNQIDLSALESGVYLIQIIAGDKIRTVKIVKE